MEPSIRRGIDSLSQIVKEFLYKDIELLRICRTAILLRECGVNPFNLVFDELAQKVVKDQREDGGWTDVEETLWCAAFLDIYEDHSESVYRAIKWLERQENKDGGWGKSDRDRARIPLTSMLLCFLPQLRTDNRLKWLENKWHQEQKMHPNLTYKIALTIMAFYRNKYKPENDQLISKSISLICEQQNNDGGWGPWKDHPVGSDPWCTGICLASLADFHYMLPVEVMKKGLGWIVKKQLPDGLWPYHYIEDGSSWALYALIKVNNLLNDSRT
ncbi:MAG: terpene cyclase/mutase family protein [Bacteroidales bacterium]|nr:terpene cyclase/mutase family protein [Bacteroidales bacterium]